MALRQQAEQLKSHLQRDFEDGYNRLVVASDGLARIYGFKRPSGKPLPDNKRRLDGEDVLDANVAWVRGAIAWLVAFAQRDQAFTQVIFRPEARHER